MKRGTMEAKEIKDMIQQIEPKEWDNTHIDAHLALNRAVLEFCWLYETLVKDITDYIDAQKDAHEFIDASFSKIQERLDKIEKTLGSIDTKIKKTNERIDKWWKYQIKNYEWILDTDSETVVELEEIVLDWNYLVNIVPCEVIPNSWTEIYSLPQTSIATGSYTPKVYLMAKQWEHAVLEYDFNVILTQI